MFLEKRAAIFPFFGNKRSAAVEYQYIASSDSERGLTVVVFAVIVR